MNFRELIDGHFEPLWRHNARRDADAFKDELSSSSPTRRRFLAGAGVALLAEYLDTRRAIAAFPRGSVSTSGLTQITNARTGTTYQYLYQALVAMQSGDTILLPAGLTHQFGGSPVYYANYRETNWIGRVTGVSGSGFGSTCLGATGNYGGKLAADYGTIQGVGTTNNGRALMSPPFGILAADFHHGDTEMFFDPSTPVSRFDPAGNFVQVIGNYNFAQFANVNMSYTGLDLAGNGLTGMTDGLGATAIPAGTLICAYIVNGKGIFVTCGQNPGWTFTNLEFAYTAWAGGQNVVSSIQQSDSNPGGPYVGSMTLNNCYIHDTKQGPGLGYSGIGSTGAIFAHMFDTELYNNGAYHSTNSDTHNTYIGHLSELIMDNCYSHHTAGTWLVKTRAALNFLRYCQIRGERTDSNPFGDDNSGVDFSNGGLCYVIGGVFQQSLNAANQTIDMSAEFGASGAMEGGALNPLVELYAVNNTFIGPANGTGISGQNGAVGKAPIRWNNLGVQNPEIPLLSQSAGGSLAARTYFGLNSVIGTGGGETTTADFNGGVGALPIVWNSLAISANNLITVASPFTHTGASTYNCYMNYDDPQPFLNYSFPQVQQGNLYFWDAGFTQPVFSQTSGGTLISITGTLTNGSNQVTALSGLTGLASITQLRDMSLYTPGGPTGLFVSTVNVATGTLSLNGNYTGITGSVILTFGYYLYCGFTYATALGDSVLLAIQGFNPVASGATWYDGSYTFQTTRLVNAATIQIDPGNRLVVAAPPTGPTWATGVNFWAALHNWDPGWGYVGVDNFLDAGIIGLTKLTSSPMSFAGSFTTSPGILVKSQVLQQPLFLQNASPISIGTPFTEASTGLVNLNPTRTKLQWFRRGASFNGGVMESWYAVVPGGGLSSYSDTIYLQNAKSTLIKGALSIWRGCTAGIFDANFPSPSMQTSNVGSITTAGGNVTVLALFRSGGTAGAGYTQLQTATGLNAMFASFSAGQTALPVTETGGSSADILMTDCLTGTSAAPTLVTSQLISGASGSAQVNFTVASANAGDILYLQIITDQANLAAIGQIGPPPYSLAVNASPYCLVQNCLTANFNSAAVGGGLVVTDRIVAMPAGAVTETTNLKANPFNGTTFGSPTWATVFSDSNQADYVYTLASGSPALNAASNPGSSPEGQNLIPTFQTGWSGLPTPGTPIPAKVGRTDIGPALTGSIGALI